MKNGNRRGKVGAGRGKGLGRPVGQGAKRARQGQGAPGGHTAGSGAVTSDGTCVCPQCGHQQPHERGVPCMQKKCVQCGGAMTRQFI